MPAAEPAALPASLSAKKRPVKAIVFAWGIELCAVLLGLVNAYMTSLDRAELPLDRKFMIAAPFAMVAVAELSRIPLVQLFFYARNWLIRAACLIAVVSTAGLTIENFAFGIERLISLRVEDVTQAKAVLDEADANLRRQLARNEQKAQALRDKHERVVESMNERTTEIDRLNGELKKIEDGRQFEIEQHTQRCKAVGTQCSSPPFIARINDEANRKRAPLQAQLDRQFQERERLRQEFTAVAAEETEAAAAAAEVSAAARDRVAKAAEALAGVIENSQMHRMAGAWYGIRPADLSNEQFGKVRTFFSLFSATIISAMGSMLAFGYYAEGRGHDPSRERDLLFRALRAYMARLRKKVVRVQERVIEVTREVEKPVEVIKEKPVTIIKERVRWIPHPAMLASIAEEEKARAADLGNVVELAKKG